MTGIKGVWIIVSSNLDIRLGFIGAGNMGQALIRGIVKSGIVLPDKIFVYDINREQTDLLKKDTGVTPLDSGIEVVRNSDVIVVAVKPNIVEKVLEECKEAVDSKKVIVSIAVGVPISLFKRILGNDRKIIRTMPNTPALVGEGITLISHDGSVGNEDLEAVRTLFNCVGKTEMLDEKLMCEVTALTSSSPAYVFMFIEAMADAAVLSGLPRGLSYKLAAQAVLGSAKMVLNTGKHPGELKDQVCSPAGTTIEAVKALEKNGFRYAVIEAMNECTRRAREINKNS
ncbi:MAG TPA: pyrroline-5-carboxylate reductase [Clostridiaceae bacterium]|nr:pyrroline-5-carboxylate reductase [Clostridiaceae bacterium]